MPYFALNFVYAGRIPFRQGGGRWAAIEGPAAFWTRPGIRYEYGVHPPDTWNHLYVTFSGPRASRMLRSRLIPARSAAEPGIPIHEPEQFRRGFEELHRELARSPQGGDRATHLLEGLFLQLHRQAPMHGVERDSARKLRELITLRSKPPRRRIAILSGKRAGWAGRPIIFAGSSGGRPGAPRWPSTTGPGSTWRLGRVADVRPPQQACRRALRTTGSLLLQQTVQAGPWVAARRIPQSVSASCGTALRALEPIPRGAGARRDVGTPPPSMGGCMQFPAAASG